MPSIIYTRSGNLPFFQRFRCYKLMRQGKHNNQIIRQIELFLKKFITAFGRRCGPFDSHIRICYFCCILRFHLRRRKPSRFWINTRNATYIFEQYSKLKLIQIIVNPTLRNTVELWRPKNGQLTKIFSVDA